MRDRLSQWYNNGKKYATIAITSIQHPRKAYTDLTSYIASLKRYKDVAHYTKIASDGLVETSKQVMQGLEYVTSSPHGSYDRLLLIDKDPVKSELNKRTVLVVQRKEGSLIAYWLEDGLNKDGLKEEIICHQSFKEAEVKLIIERLPKVNKESADLFLINSVIAKYGLTSPMEDVRNRVVDIWQGFSRVIDPANVSKLLKRPETRSVLYYAISANLWYFSMVMFYEKTVKGTLRYIPGMEESYPEAALDAAAYTYLFTHAIEMMIDNSFYNATVAKVSGQEEGPCDHFKPCSCNIGKQLKGMLGSSFYMMTDQLAINCFTNSLPILGMPVKVGLTALRFGQVFLEYKLAAKGMCTEHRYQLLTQNNQYAFGFGLSYLTLCNTIAWYLKRKFGVSNSFLDDAIFSGVFPLYIFLAQTIDAPLPGKKTGFDVFKFSRYATSYTLSNSTRWLGQYVSNPKNEKMIRDMKEALINFPPFQLFCFSLASEAKVTAIEEKIADLCQRDAILLYLDYSKDDIKDLIAYIRSMRESYIYNAASAASDYVPFLAKDQKKVLDILLDDRVKEVLNSVESVLSHIEVKQGISVYTTRFERLRDALKLKELLGKLQVMCGFNEKAPVEIEKKVIPQVAATPATTMPAPLANATMVIAPPDNITPVTMPDLPVLPVNNSSAVIMQALQAAPIVQPTPILSVDPVPVLTVVSEPAVSVVMPSPVLPVTATSPLPVATPSATIPSVDTPVLPTVVPKINRRRLPAQQQSPFGEVSVMPKKKK